MIIMRSSETRTHGHTHTHTERAIELMGEESGGAIFLVMRTRFAGMAGNLP